MDEPWGLNGPQFLTVYWIAVAVAVAAVIAVRAWSRKPVPTQPGTTPDAYELALLSGGFPRVTDTAMAAAVDRGALRVSREGAITVTGAPPGDPVQAFLLSQMPSPARLGQVIEIDWERSAIDEAMTERLAARGLIASPSRLAAAFRWHWPLVALFVIGVARLIVGIAGDYPVGYLVLSLCAVGVIWLGCALALHHNGSVPTLAGHRAVRDAKARTPARDPRGQVTEAETAAGVLLPVALYGLAAYPDDAIGGLFYQYLGAVPGTPLAAQPMQPAQGGGGSGGGSSCGSSCGGSSCGSGSSCSSGGGSSCGGGGGCGGGSSS
ncbi:uncharacterized protein (TIGR04222 family) [Herbihabitans rhizosphaerae]|uniref:Uncharacterized protein (TIGR04222 family) n=1 Tax=Herbihabitans rhizosphaerae TaxID=1872711 RepID=A0A4Q7KDV3_9PSEU|nr:TIGR04222 domain-containing membrane protein [Herbihabitans rhizosphaerae]RZS31434.1 uncharacterized protein (TIGR04222 family) [Herbihabitans rhizosphaerae]